MVKRKPKFTRRNTVSFLTLTLLLVAAHTASTPSNSGRTESTKSPNTQVVSAQSKEPVKSTENESDKTQSIEENKITIVDPNGCEAKGMWYRADNNECIEKPKLVETVQPITSTPQTYSAGSGDCASELTKYDWDQATAYRVMMKESSNNPGNLNNNPGTGDYSVGCFQINLYGANASSRPSEAWLKVAANNVAYAYQLWSGSRSFMGHWPNTCRAVGC